MTTLDARGPGRAMPSDLPPWRAPEALFPDTRIDYVDRWPSIAAARAALEDQRPSTCGAYAARYLLGPLGFPVHAGIPTTREDYLAFLAGTVLETWEDGPARATREEVRSLGLDDAAAAARFPQAWYGWDLRSTADPAVAGTAPAGTARTVSLASDGALVTLPIAARRLEGSVLLTPPRWEALLDFIAADGPRLGLHPIVNYQSDELLNPVTDAYSAAALTAPDPEALIPLDSWGVGHFAGVGAIWRPADGRRWLLLVDTYRNRGFAGFQPQPAELVRRGLVRSDGREGGVLLAMPRESLDETAAAAAAMGLEARMWSNGSLDPERWTWSLGQ
ncbi:MAG: hypothetical protein HW391_845 [Chloroflexi bacterium]|nr:hypothetical protein [Chloroflexota bacterium]